LGRYVTGFGEGVGYWLFAFVVGASLCGGYVLLGATWLVLRTESDLRQKSIVWARWGLLWVALGVALVSLGTPLVSETVRAKWFDFPRTLWLMLLPLATLAARGEPCEHAAAMRDADDHAGTAGVELRRHALGEQRVAGADDRLAIGREALRRGGQRL